MTEFEQKLFNSVARKIKDDNADLQALSDKVMEYVREYCDKHKKDYKTLNDFEKQRLGDVRFVLSQVARVKYSKKQLDSAIENNLKRIPGNLADESKREDLYNVLSNLNFKCIYSDTLLVGGGQKIHLDHIIPVNLGGPTDDWNILPICGSCNSSKSDSHLLDWWEKEHTAQDEHKLVYIFEYMANRLLKSLNTKGVKVVTTLTDDEIRKAIELENKERQQESKQQTIDLEEEYALEEDYEDVEEVKDEKIKRLDAITFLYQLLNHIKQNKQYIISPDNLNQGILDTPSDKDKQRLIDKKFKKLEKLFNSIYKQNKRLTGVKTDIQLLDEQRKMVEYIKSLDIVSYYHISYIYFDELQQMLDQGKTDKEIQEFCYEHDRAFNIDKFIQELQGFIASHDGEYPKQHSKDDNERSLGIKVGVIRSAKRGRGRFILTADMIEKLNKANFIWDGTKRFDFEKFYKELISYKEEFGDLRVPQSYINPITGYKLGGIVNEIRCIKRALNEWEELSAEEKEKTSKPNKYGLTSEQYAMLENIHFIWEPTEDWFTPFCEELEQFIKEKGRYPRETKNRDVQEVRLANQVKRIRQAREGEGSTKLTDEMIVKLDSMNFVWERPHKRKWGDWFIPFCENLKIFIKENGRYPSITAKDEEEKKLAGQVDALRRAKEGKVHRKLTPEMVDVLDDMNFAWTIKDSPYVEATWFTMFCENLKKFIKEEGRYPSQGSQDDKEKKLAQKITSIRATYKKIQNNEKTNMRLTEEMISKLEEMNFAWTAKDEPEVEPSWFAPLCKGLQRFIIETGRYPLISSQDDNEKKLAYKINDVRKAKKGKGGAKLTEEMINKLNAIHFAWTGKEQKEKIALFLAEQGIGQELSA